MLKSKLSLKQQYNALVSKKIVSTMTRWVYITFLNESIYRIYTEKNDMAKCFFTQNLFNDVPKVPAFHLYLHLNTKTGQ